MSTTTRSTARPPARPEPSARTASRGRGARPEAGPEPTVDVHRGRRVILWSLAVLTALVVGTLAAVYSPLLDVRRVDVVGAPPDRIDEVRGAAGIEVGDPIATFLPNRVAARVDRLAWVDTATVTRSLPHRVTITVVPREAVGSLAAGTRFLLVDATGRVLWRLDHAPEGLPLLVGAADLAPPGGTVRPVALARSAGALGPEMRLRTASVTVDDGALTVQVDGGPALRFGAPRAVAVKARVAAAVLASLAGSPVQYVDVSVPTAPVSG